MIPIAHACCRGCVALSNAVLEGMSTISANALNVPFRPRGGFCAILEFSTRLPVLLRAYGPIKIEVFEGRT